MFLLGGYGRKAMRIMTIIVRSGGCSGRRGSSRAVVVQEEAGTVPDATGLDYRHGGVGGHRHWQEASRVTTHWRRRWV